MAFLSFLKSKKGIISCSIIIGIVIFACITDNWQQARFETLRSGYDYMEAKHYGDAISSFEEYLDVDSDIYWFFTELINDYDYSKEAVHKAIEKCEDEINTLE